MVYRFQCYLFLFLLVAGCSVPAAAPTVAGDSPLLPVLTVDPATTLPAPVAHLATAGSFDPATVRYFDLVNRAMPLNDAELTLLTQNGFVVTDRLAWARFVEAYAWIYKNDLPVVVTSDSILHALHQSYSNVLKLVEVQILQPLLVTLLQELRTQVMASASAVENADLATAYADLEEYLTVALVLTTGAALQVNGQPFQPEQHGFLDPAMANVQLDGAKLTQAYTPRVARLVELAWQADNIAILQRDNDEAPALLQSPHTVDFTLFQPRAHYASSLTLGNYFRAMIWLAQMDFRLVEFDPATNEPTLNQPALIAAYLLQTALDDSGQRAAWQTMNALLEQLVGLADNTTLPDLDRLRSAMGWATVHDVATADPQAVLTQLLTHDYGQQRITGQLIGRHSANSSEQPVPRPVSFMLFGQRFALDSWILGNVVYDRLFVDDRPVERALPTGFDLMVALGNDHAQEHLAAELATYGYAATLATLRQQVDALPPAFWHAPIYNQWLQMIRTLNPPTTAAPYPAAMRTTAWADKTLQTQLASWTQLRHDNLLYVKQSYTTVQILCEFPAVYVEPYPALYQALADFAETGQQLAQTMQTSGQAPLRPLFGGQNKNTPASAIDRLQQYFFDVAESATLLTTISEKELAGQSLTAAEQHFLESLVIEQGYSPGCGGVSFEEMWDGWYMHMIYGKDESPALIADLHTNPNNDPSSALYPPRVLHAGTGPATALLMIVETADGPTLFVGPAFAYYEFTTEGFPPVRLTDEQWRDQLTQPTAYPAAPAWVRSFRIPATAPPQRFVLPTHNNYLKK